MLHNPFNVEVLLMLYGPSNRADPSTTLQRLIDSNLEDYLPKFETVSEAASKEHVFEKNLEKMKVVHDPLFVFKTHIHFFKKRAFLLLLHQLLTGYMGN